MRAVCFDGDHQWSAKLHYFIPEGSFSERVDLKCQDLVCVPVEFFNKGKTVAAIDLSRYIQGIVCQDGGDKLIEGILTDGLLSCGRNLAADKLLKVFIFLFKLQFRSAAFI
jgi:hypothetical protein